MRITILGATGGTGLQLVERALDLGHDVTVVVRDPAGLATKRDKVHALAGDVFDSATLVPALQSAQAVVSALGTRRGSKQWTVCSEATSAILQAMDATDVRRLVVVGSAMVPRADPGDGPVLRRLLKPISYRMFPDLYADLALMQTQLEENSADWTVVRPPLLTDSPATGRYHTALGHNAAGRLRVSRADLADAMLRCLDDPSTIRTTVGIAG